MPVEQEMTLRVNSDPKLPKLHKKPLITFHQTLRESCNRAQLLHFFEDNEAVMKMLI